MPEYRIWTITGPSRRPAIPDDRLLDVLQPRGYYSVSVDGPGDLRLALGGCEMVFSSEDDGWHVWFEGDPTGLFEGDTTGLFEGGADLDHPGFLVSRVARQIHEFTGGHIKWIRND